ncbi:MAG TPA: MarR family transcriptional regulator [Acidimicrobiales bacterium]|nr:MarR family transcriptional regulator [Acidimicrobiales bacterium]
MSAPAPPGPAPVAQWRQRFIEDLGGLVVDYGTPRAVVRVLGWMVVSDPPEQSAREIQEELTLSAGSVSAAVRMLADAGMLERVSHPGDRHIYYRLRPEGWALALAARLRSLVQLRQVADRALQAAGPEADHRLLSMRDTYSRIEVRMAELLPQSPDLAPEGAVSTDRWPSRGGAR